MKTIYKRKQNDLWALKILTTLAVFSALMSVTFRMAGSQVSAFYEDSPYLASNDAKTSLFKTKQVNGIQKFSLTKDQVRLDYDYLPEIQPEEVEAVLKHYGSPAQGLGLKFVEFGKQYNINPRIALAFFIQESSAGTLGKAVYNRSVGNITNGRGGFVSYKSWEEGLEHWFIFLNECKYYRPSGRNTVEALFPYYCPDNPRQYIANVRKMVSGIWWPQA
ncbi:MAG: hypothetical protein V1653_02810 [bacterium]